MVPVVLVFALAGCASKRTQYYCDDQTPCEIPGTVCNQIDHNCIPAPDALGSDGAVGVDAAGPVVDTFQAASLVLGQPDFMSSADPGCVRNSAKAIAVAEGNGILYVRELQERAMGWTPVPSGNDATPTFVLGKTSFTDCTVGGPVDATHFGQAGGLAIASGKFLLADAQHNRVEVWSPPPAADGALSQFTLGQQDSTTSGAGSAANQLANPYAVWTDGTRVAVADQGNNRVLIWNTFPTTNQDPADLVLGQSGFGMSTAPSNASDSNMSVPTGVWSDGTQLFVADTGQNRVLIWNSFPTTNGQAADVVVGQSDFTTKGTGLAATAMNSPHGVAANADALFVADLANDRVLVFSPLPTSNGEAAQFVLGQPSLDTGGNNPPASAQSLNVPRQLFLTGSKLWITDEGHNRVLRFDLYP